VALSVEPLLGVKSKHVLGKRASNLCRKNNPQAVATKMGPVQAAYGTMNKKENDGR